MATEELRALRLRYKAAYTAYMKCVQAMTEASQKGTRPDHEVLAAERNAFDDLTGARQSLLAALERHVTKLPGGSPPQQPPTVRR